MSTILEAVANNDAQMLSLLILPASPDQHPHPQAKLLRQALFAAVRAGHVSCVDVLVRVLGDLDTRDSLGNTPLKVAAEEGHGQVVQLLLNKGSKVNAYNVSMTTALHAACRHSRDDCVDMLLASGANANIKDAEGNTPLHSAAQRGRVSTRMVSSLVRYGCDINVADNQGRIALHHVSRSAAGVDAFLSVAGCNVNVQDLDGNTPLTLASIEGFDEVVKSLLQSGANPNIKNARNKAPLHYLAMKNHCVAIEAIVNSCVTFPDNSAPDINVATRRGKTPLWYAISRNRPEAVKALLIANCRPDVTPVDHEVIAQPVELALNKGLYELAKLLALVGCCQHPVRQWLSRTDLAASLHQRDANAAVFQTAYAGMREIQGNERNELEQELLKEAKEWFTEWTTSPHSLMQLCRIRVRRMLGDRVSVKIGQLPVPSAVRNYLALTEIKDHYVKGYLI